METEDLIRLLQERGINGLEVKGLDPNGDTYAIKDVRTEFIVGEATVWVELELD